MDPEEPGAPAPGEDDELVEGIPSDSLPDPDWADGFLSVPTTRSEETAPHGPARPPRGRWGQAPERPPRAKRGKLLSWEEVNQYVDRPAGSEAGPQRRLGERGQRGSGRPGKIRRAAWVFLYVVGLAAMAVSFPIAFAIHGDSFGPLLLFPAGGIAALAGTILAWLES